MLHWKNKMTTGTVLKKKKIPIHIVHTHSNKKEKETKRKSMHSSGTFMAFCTIQPLVKIYI